MLVLLHEILLRLWAHEAVALEVLMVGDCSLSFLSRTEAVALRGILISKAVCTDDLEETVIGAIGGDVVLEVDGLPLGRLDEGLGHLSVLDDRVLDPHFLLHEAR